MKKIYETPATETVEIESAYLLAGSAPDGTLRVFDKDDDEYVNPDQAL